MKIQFHHTLGWSQRSRPRSEDHDGGWIAVEGNHEHIIVDSGDMLQNLTNGLFKANDPRVSIHPMQTATGIRCPCSHTPETMSMTPRPEFIERTGGKALYPHHRW